MIMNKSRIQYDLYILHNYYNIMGWLTISTNHNILYCCLYYLFTTTRVTLAAKIDFVHNTCNNNGQ